MQAMSKGAIGKLLAPGTVFHWPDIDEDLSTEGLLRGVPAPRSPRIAVIPEELIGQRLATATEQRKSNLV
jgi:hypothetical protein